MQEGWQGWDTYARFYDWENARTVGRKDIGFWRDLGLRVDGRVLELGSGTGRLALPLLKANVPLVGIDRSLPMLMRAAARARRARLPRPALFVRGDIRHLPFRARPGFSLVMAPYGMLQSLVRERDLEDTLASVARVLRRGGLFGVDLVPDLPRWPEYQRKKTLSGKDGVNGHLTLVESVRQDRRLTIFDQEYIEQRGNQRSVHRFSLTFRTVSVPAMTRRLERAGFRIDAVLGDYRGGPWHDEADVWMILARK